MGCCLLLSLSTPARGADRAAYWGLLTRAVGEVVEGELPAAVASLGRARAEAPAAAAVVDTFVGLVALAGGQVEAARRHLERAIARRWAEPLLFYWAARAALRAGRSRVALGYMDRALALGRDRAPLWIGDALIARAAGRSSRAAASAAEAARLWPNLLDPRLFPTPAEGAVELLGRALHELPDPLRLWRTQAHLYWRLDQVLGARQQVSRVLARQPDDADALQLGARCALALGQLDDALRLSARAVQVRGVAVAQALATRGLVLAAAGRGSEALVWLRRGADARPRDVELLLVLAQVCAAAEQGDCARRFFGWAARLAPEQGAAQLGLGLEHLQQGRLEEARVALARAIRAAPGDPRAYAAAAQVERQRGRAPDELAGLLRAAARVASVERRLMMRVGRVAAAGQRMLLALAACRCEDGPCTPPAGGCLRAASRPSGAAGWFLRSHLAAVNGKGASALAAARAAVARLSPALLLGATAPTALWAEGRGLDGVRYRLRRAVAWVPLGDSAALGRLSP
ncbi:MAG: tetratricopeptide repeat protein [Proteobacteria bacterium]|nr:tetratricopeptide repeat protein [Pseudomonadota bacterium]